MKLPVHATTGKNSSLTAPVALFGQEMNPSLLAQAVRVYMSNKRQGSSKVQSRSAVTLVKAKWYRQKGTGNARHGSKNAPIFVGGGVAHGPKGIENWKKKLSAKQRQKALTVALSAQVKNVTICDDIEKLSGKTKQAAALITTIAPDKKVLLILENSDQAILRATANLPKVALTKASRVNALEVASADAIIMTKTSLKALENRISGKSK